MHDGHEDDTIDFGSIIAEYLEVGKINEEKSKRKY
jgi:hypothetical protein